ncbi:MAG TPA: diacylglycerol kinase [bacterium]|nr:diacylglycerol kinase [bacterium]
MRRPGTFGSGRTAPHSHTVLPATPSRPRRPRSFAASLGSAVRGLVYAVGTQRNVRVHLVLAAGVLIAGGLTGLGGVELAVLALTIGLVLVAELLNTALENVTDYVHPDAGPVAAVVKDVAAAAVLVSVVLAVCVAVFVFAPHFDFFVASRTVPLVLAAACLAALLAAAARAR